MHGINGGEKGKKYSLVHETNVYIASSHIVLTFFTKHQRGRSALSLALERGDVDLMMVLIERGANVNTQDEVSCIEVHITST